MADARFDALTELTSPAADDRYAIDDDSADTTKYIKHENIFKTIADDKFTMQDNADASKQLQFQLSGITASNTRVLTVPDFNGTIATLAGTETLSGKTLTAAVIATSLDMNGTEFILDADADTSLTADTDDQIDVRISGADDFRFVANIFRALSGSTLETDTINETTAASGVTIDGLNIKDSKLVTADSVVTANYTDGSILPEHLVSGNGTSWADQAWVPTFTGFSVAPTITHARYTLIGKTCTIWLRALGGTSNATSFTFELPFTVSANITTGVALPILAQDNGAIGTTPGRADIVASDATVTCYTNYDAGAWTATGTKGVICSFSFPVA